MKNCIIIFLLFFYCIETEAKNPPFKNAIGIDIINGVRGLSGLGSNGIIIKDNWGIILSRYIKKNDKLVFAFNRYSKDYSASAFPQTYYVNRSISGNKFKLAYQFLRPINELNWIKSVWGIGGSYSLNQLAYETILYEPVFQTQKILSHKIPVNILSCEMQFGVELKVKKRWEFTFVPVIGMMRKSRETNEILYACPTYGFVWKTTYIGLRSHLSYCFN